MPATGLKQKTCRINDYSFPLAGDVQTFIASGNPPKYVTGEFELDTHPYVSTQEWKDFRGGVGKDTYDKTDPFRAWWATTSLKHRGHNVLQRRAVQTAAASSTGAVGFIGDIGSAVFASFGTAVHSYNNSTDNWGASVRSLAAAATDSLSCMLNGSYTLVVAQDSDLDWTTDGASWNRDTTNIKYVAFWREMLWGIANTGETYFTSNLSNSFTQDATLRLQSGSINELFIGPSAIPNEDALYCATTTGLMVYDVANSRWETVRGFDIPFHTNNGKGSIAWRGKIYYPAGHAVYQYDPTTGATRVVGPDIDDGLPSDRRGVITALASTHNDLIAGMNGATGEVTDLDTFLGTETWVAPNTVIPSDSGIPTILGWGGGYPPEGQGGWEVKWPSGSAGNVAQPLFVTSTYSLYRLWWGSGGRIFYMSLPTDIVNPAQVSTTQYESTGLVETPWFVVPGNQDGTALRCFLETRNPTSSETVTLAYARNFVESFTTLGTNSSAEEKVYNFNDASSNPTGLAFRSIRFRATLNRGTTNTNSPDMVKLAFAYTRTFSYLKGVRIPLDIRNVAGRTAKELRKQLDTILATKTQFLVQYRDESDTEEEMWAMVSPEYQGIDKSERDFTGTHVLTLVEAI